MKNKIILFVSMICLSIACNIGTTSIKGITSLANKADCKGPCGKVMPCEGKPMTLEVEIGNGNIMQSGNTLFVRDPDNYDYTIKIEFSESVPPEKYINTKDTANKKFKVTGIVEGYDVFVHETCMRSYIFKVSDPKNFEVLDK